MHRNHTLSFLQSQNATLAVLALALCAQIPHAADVFRLIPHVLSGIEFPACDPFSCLSAFLHGYLFAVALELAVLLFVVRNKQRESYAFAVVSVAMNLAYYHLHEVRLFDASALPAWLVSVSLPAAIALYSHAVADTQAEQPQRQPRTVRTVRHTEQTEQLAVYEPEQSVQPVTIEHEQPVDLSAATDEQKRQYLEQVLASTDKPNKTQLARELGIGRTTLYAWISEVSDTQTARS